MLSGSLGASIIGTVSCPSNRPATATDVWVQLCPRRSVSLHDLLVIESGHQQLLGTVIDVQLVEEEGVYHPRRSQPRTPSRKTWAQIAILSSSDGQRRPPDGTTVRRPCPREV